MKVFSLDNQKGSMTVEASIVIPVVFLSVIALVILAIAQFEFTSARSAADLASEAGADFFDSSRKDLATGKISKKDLCRDGLYSKLFDPDAAGKLDKVETYAAGKMQGNIKDAQDITCIAELSNWILYKKITVNITASDSRRENESLPIYGIISGSRYGAVSESVVYDPAEFIRNTDFLTDLERELENKYPGLKNIGDKTRGAIMNMKNKAEDFLE